MDGQTEARISRGPGRPATEGPADRPVSIVVRFKAEDRERIKQFAEGQGMSLGSFVRSTLFRAVGKNQAG